MINIFKIAKAIVTKVQQQNERNPEVKTADTSVFDKMNERIDQSTKQAETSKPADLSEIYESLRKQVDEVKVENEVDPQVETADSSVFEDMMKEIEELKQKVAEQETKEVPSGSSNVGAPSAGPGGRAAEMMAMTNSNGGSLALRMEPNMGAPVNHIRVPDFSLVKVMEYSQNSINLDGKQSRFVLVDFDGQQGWMLESYLNFN